MIEKKSKKFVMQFAAFATACSMGTAGCDVAPPEQGVDILEADGSTDTEACSLEFSGEELVRGVFFKEGVAASFVPDLPVHIDQKVAELMAADDNDGARDEFASKLLGSADRRIELAGRASTLAHQAELQGETDQAYQLRTLASVLSGADYEGMDGASVIRTVFVEHMKKADPTFFDRFATEMQSGDPLRVDSVLQEGGKLIYGATMALAEAAEVNTNVLADVGNGQGQAAVAMAAVVAVSLAVGVLFVAVVYTKFWIKDLDDGDPTDALRRAEYVAELTRALEFSCR